MQKNSLGIYKRLLVYVKPFMGLFLVSIFGFLIYSTTQYLLPVLIQHILDTLKTQEREGMEFLPLFFCGLFFIQGIGNYLGNYFLAKVSTNVVHALRCEIFDKYTQLPTAFFDANNSGFLISRITNNVGEMTKASTDAVRTFVREGLTVFVLLIYLFKSNWLLSLTFLAIAPIIVVLVKYVSKRLRKLSKRMQESVGDITHITSEMVVGNRIVRGYGGEEYEKKRFRESSYYNRGQALKMATTTAVHNPIMQFIIAIALAFLMYMALIFMREASVGEFSAYLMTAILIQRPIRQLSDANSDIQKGIAAAQSIFDILDVPGEIDTGNYQIEKVRGNLEFKNLSFYYDGMKEPALSNINFKAEPGQTVALVGSSGGGKSTLVNLVSRFYNHQVGEILLDGIEINQYRLANLRSHVALFTQNVILI